MGKRASQGASLICSDCCKTVIELDPKDAGGHNNPGAIYCARLVSPAAPFITGQVIRVNGGAVR